MLELRLIAVWTLCNIVLVASAHADEEGFTATDIRAVYADACSAHGIDPPKCDCIVDGLLASHSANAIMANGLGMVLRDEEAVALTDQVGESAVWAASDTFDLLQNTSCAAMTDADSPDNTEEAAESAVVGAETPN